MIHKNTCRITVCIPVSTTEGNTRPRWSLACENTCIREGKKTPRRLLLREIPPALAIVASFAYLVLPTNLAEMSILAYYCPSYKIYFVCFLYSPRKLPKVRYCPSLKCILYISYVRILARQQTPIASRFLTLGLPKSARGRLKETILYTIKILKIHI